MVEKLEPSFGWFKTTHVSVRLLLIYRCVVYVEAVPFTWQTEHKHRALGVILLLTDKSMNTNEVGDVFILSYGFEKATLLPSHRQKYSSQSNIICLKVKCQRTYHC